MSVLGMVITRSRLASAVLLGTVGVLPPLESSEEHDAERVPLRDMGTWLQAVPDEGRAAFLAKCIVEQIRHGLRELGTYAEGAPAVPDAATLTRLEGTYGAYWVTTVLHDDAAALTALSQYSPLAEHD